MAYAVMIILLCVAVYCPLSALGHLAWRYVYDPYFDAVDQGEPWAMFLFLFAILALMVCAKVVEDQGYR